MIIPEIQLQKIVDGIFLTIKKDWEANTDKRDTYLSIYFEGQIMNGLDYYIQAQRIFLTDDGDPSKVQSRIFFDTDRASLPTVHIVLPMEVPGENGIGVDQDSRNYYYNEDTGVHIPLYDRRFDSNYHLICTSKNTIEVLIIYHLLKGMMIGLFDSLDLAWGFSNPKIGGGEVTLDPGLIPPNIYARAIDFNASYEFAVPSVVRDSHLINSINSVGTLKETLEEETLEGEFSVEEEET